MNTIKVIYKENIKSTFRLTNLNTALIPNATKVHKKFYS